MKYNFAEYEKKLKKYLDKDRYRHTLGVMYTAASLAMAHDYDMEQAQMAGLLHDCAILFFFMQSWAPISQRKNIRLRMKRYYLLSGGILRERKQ